MEKIRRKVLKSEEMNLVRAAVEGKHRRSGGQNEEECIQASAGQKGIHTEAGKQ